VSARGTRTYAAPGQADKPVRRPYRIRVMGLVGDDRTPLRPVYLATYDPTAADGQGLVSWTSDLNEARTFDTLESAMACYQHQVGLRPDGKPNRPLTAFTVAFERV
jgi:hypothetical protein